MRKAAVLFVAGILMLPVYFMVIGSFQEEVGLAKMPPNLLPRGSTVQNYEILFRGGIGQWFGNTVGIAGLVMILATFLVMTSGYALMRPFRGSGSCTWLILLCAVMPASVLLIPRFVLLRIVGLQAARVSAVFPLLVNPVAILAARTWFRQLPAAFYEEARLNGMGEWQILWTILFPLAKPIIAVTALFQGMAALGDYLWQSIILREERTMTLLVGTIWRSTSAYIDWVPNPLGLQQAAAVIAAAPMVLIFLFAARWFVQMRIA